MSTERCEDAEAGKMPHLQRFDLTQVSRLTTSATEQSPTASDPAGEVDPAPHAVTVVPDPEMRPPGHLRGARQEHKQELVRTK